MSDLPSVASVASIEKRLAGVEGSLRRWKLGFAALALVVVGVAADGVAVRDVEFGTVKARAFGLIDKKGDPIGLFMSDGKEVEKAFITLRNSDQTKTTVLSAGNEPYYKNK
jgi:hypothetical protein